MKNNVTTSDRYDRFSYLWLFIGFLFFIFSNGRWMIAPAPWFAFFFILRFVRTQKRLKGFLITGLVIGIGGFIQWFGVLIMPAPIFTVMSVISGFIAVIPFLIDRIIQEKIKGFWGALVFPASMTAMEFIMAQNPTIGTWGALGYTQYGNLPLMQLSSITGIWGIAFLITWFASVGNFCWEEKLKFKKVKIAASAFIVIFILIHGFGILRLSTDEELRNTVRVAAITTPSDIRTRGMAWYMENRSPFNLEESLDLLRRQTRQAASGGAQIVVWQEYADWISFGDEQAYVREAQELARELNIYLAIGPGIIDEEREGLGKNITIMISPEGEILWEYKKSYLAPVLEEPYFIPGTREIPVINTPFGFIGSVICFDFDFPPYVSEVPDDVSLMVVPSFDWEAISPLHSHMAVFRAIENGFSLVRPVGEGLSVAVDPLGRILNEQDYFTSLQRIMVSDLPIRSITTVYEVIGDVLPLACFFLVLVIAIMAFINTRRERRTS